MLLHCREDMHLKLVCMRVIDGDEFNAAVPLSRPDGSAPAVLPTDGEDRTAAA